MSSYGGRVFGVEENIQDRGSLRKFFAPALLDDYRVGETRVSRGTEARERTGASMLICTMS